MKRKITMYAVSIASVVILLMSGCKKEDTSATPLPNPVITPKDTVNFVEYDGVKHEVTNAHIFYTTLFEGVGGCYFYYVYLVSQGVSYSSNFNTMTGTGDGLRLSIIAASPSNYMGTYAIDTLNNVVAPGELYGRFYTNSHFSVMVTGTADELLRGSCTISQITANTVLITGSFKTSNNKILKLNYTGILPRHEIDY